LLYETNKKDGYRQRKVRQFLQSAQGTFWPPLGTPMGQSRLVLHGWKEDSMLVKRITAYTHLSSTVLRAIARYCSEIATFSYRLAFNAPVGGVPIGIPEKNLVLIKLWG